MTPTFILLASVYVMCGLGLFLGLQVQVKSLPGNLKSRSVRITVSAFWPVFVMSHWIQT